ncbi:MAG: hypothetical protein ACKVRN_10355 [Pyrinomonadaceae bacterium]
MKFRHIIWTFALLGIIFLLADLCAAQASKNLSEDEKLLGKIKSVVFQRTYLVFKGQNVTWEPHLLGTDVFDTKGRLIQTSVYGDGEERTSFNWVGNTYTASVSYFDSKGKPAPNLRASFAAQTDKLPENDLCPNFSIKKEKDSSLNIELEFEICSDNSVRRTTTSEFSAGNHLLRELIEDSKKRTWETTYNYGLNFALNGTKFTVNNLKKPKYWHELTYGDKQYDERKNWIRWGQSATNSIFPGQIRYQYFEERIITYYE